MNQVGLDGRHGALALRPAMEERARAHEHAMGEEVAKEPTLILNPAIQETVQVSFLKCIPTYIMPGF